MTELDFLARHETAAAERLQRAIFGGGVAEPPVEILERVTVDHPFLAVGGAAAAGGLLGALLGSAAGVTLGRLVRLVPRSVWNALRRGLTT